MRKSPMTWCLAAALGAAHGARAQPVEGSPGEYVPAETADEEWWSDFSSWSGGAFLVPLGRVRGLTMESNDPKQLDLLMVEVALLELRLRYWLPRDVLPYAGFEIHGGTVGFGLSRDPPKAGVFGGIAVNLRAAAEGGLARPELSFGAERTEYFNDPGRLDSVTETFGQLRYGVSPRFRPALDVRWTSFEVVDPDPGHWRSASALLLGGGIDIVLSDPKGDPDYGWHLVGDYGRSLATDGTEVVQRWTAGIRYRQSVDAEGGWGNWMNRLDAEARWPLVRLEVAPLRVRRYEVETDAWTHERGIEYAGMVSAEGWLSDTFGISLAAGGGFESAVADSDFESSGGLLFAPALMLRWSKSDSLQSLWLRAGIEVPVGIEVSDRVRRPPFVPDVGEGESPGLVRNYEFFAELWGRPFPQRDVEFLLAEVGLLFHSVEFETYRYFGADWHTNKAGVMLLGFGARALLKTNAMPLRVGPTGSYSTAVGAWGVGRYGRAYDIGLAAQFDLGEREKP